MCHPVHRQCNSLSAVTLEVVVWPRKRSGATTWDAQSQGSLSRCTAPPGARKGPGGSSATGPLPASATRWPVGTSAPVYCTTLTQLRVRSGTGSEAPCTAFWMAQAE